MRFSIKVEYCLQAMLDLALKYGSGQTKIADIAKSQKIPVRFLEQLLLALKKRGVAASTRGKEGGYSLAKHPSEISVLEVVEILEGPIELAGKRMKKTPVLFEAFQELQEKIRGELRKLTLEDLVFKKRQKERSYTYNI